MEYSCILNSSDAGQSTSLFTYGGGADIFPTKFCATEIMYKTDISVGSIIVIAEGWQYRPEGWTYKHPRPDNVSAEYVTVDSAWWGDYTTRAFNISKQSGDYLTDITEDTLNQVFTIYIPKK